jgi:hypothetical protein
MATRRRPPVPLTIQVGLEPKFFYDKLKRLDPTLEDVKEREKRIEQTIIKMKYMNMNDVREIFSQVNDKLSIEYERVPDLDREIIRIIKPEEKAGQLFYKSTGTSRKDKSIAGVWFPFVSKDKRFIKLEDRYIDSYNSFEGGVKFENITDEDKSAMLDLIRNPNLFTYARFIDYTNASISARLHASI